MLACRGRSSHEADFLVEVLTADLAPLGFTATRVNDSAAAARAPAVPATPASPGGGLSDGLPLGLDPAVMARHFDEMLPEQQRHLAEQAGSH